MKYLRLKIIVVLIIVSFKISGQNDTTHLVLKLLQELEKNISKTSVPNIQKKDTIDLKTICDNKTKEYNLLKKKLKQKLDSAKVAVKLLNEQEKGPYYHYLVIKEYKKSYFDWGFCRNTTISHDYVDLLIKIEKNEKFRVYLDGSSSGQTFYRQD